MSVEKTYCSVLIDVEKLNNKCKALDDKKFYDVFNSYCNNCNDLRMQVPVGVSNLEQLSYLKRKVDTLESCQECDLL